METSLAGPLDQHGAVSKGGFLAHETVQRHVSWSRDLSSATSSSETPPWSKQVCRAVLVLCRAYILLRQRESLPP
eukprot:CAMPEP_0171522428 /NCGR_PEP_ID=MMETSP0959-20130129/7747_1 /TAXON_ID=87120 /ORGANISM="Aurantiochytrium limacinum, Strain ATCCMYA-1381" /LENGTH=74 /DNA_ID=CAMNT_0012062569 /DNA_START=665 /DNA_END=886 /DNA_ORIENTATION=+